MNETSGTGDLVGRAKKLARSAGRTGEGHYAAARYYSHLQSYLSATSAVISAALGATLSAKRSWLPDASQWLAIPTFAVAAINAVLSISKFGERADEHRKAGAEYGGLRRRADHLRLRIQKDLSREDALEELQEIGERLTDLAKNSRALTDRRYGRAKKKFDQNHPQYLEDDLSHPDSAMITHAGGVVVRCIDGRVVYLIVTASADAEEWVLPKGHIKPGESLEQTARREVLEETGVRAAVVELLDDVEFISSREWVRARFFLMQAISEGAAHEEREFCWASYNEALQRLPFKESRYLLAAAEALLQDTIPVGQKRNQYRGRAQPRSPGSTAGMGRFVSLLAATVYIYAKNARHRNRKLYKR